MRCKVCRHSHQNTDPCPVVVDYDASGADVAARVGVKPRICGCQKFIAREDAPVCPGCGEVLLMSHSAKQLIENYPYLFVCVWCTHCQHIITAQVTVMLPPLPKNAAAAGPQSNIHVPGGPLG